MIPILRSQASLWTASSGVPEQILLKLAILRETVHIVHAEYSRLLASDKRDQATKLQEIEKNLEAIRGEYTRTEWHLESFESLITTKRKRKKEAPPLVESLLSPSFLKVFGPSEFHRPDRNWEFLMVSEALRLEWRFWALETAVGVFQLEPWQRTLQKDLWPKGLLLWTENAEPLVRTSREMPVWNGRWVLAIHPTIHYPAELGLSLEKYPGAVSPTNLKVSFKWKLLFPDKTKPK